MGIKFCGGCQTDKPLDEFAFKSKAKGTRQSQCKECHRRYTKNHYDNNVQYYVKKAAVRNEKSYEKNRRYLTKYLQEHPCVDCGEEDIEVLELDHIEMVGASGLRIGAFMRSSLKRLDEELAKCEVRCANCHTRRTRRQTGWFRESYMDSA